MDGVAVGLGGELRVNAGIRPLLGVLAGGGVVGPPVPHAAVDIGAADTHRLRHQRDGANLGSRAEDVLGGKAILKAHQRAVGGAEIQRIARHVGGLGAV